MQARGEIVGPAGLVLEFVQALGHGLSELTRTLSCFVH